MNLTRIQEFFFKKPTGWDVLWMILFVVLITYQPFYMHHEIIMMETGIHLPAINALFHGAVPYRDFFFLRGPLELYAPAVLMKIFGINSAVLPTFYYAGTVLTLIFCVILAGELFQSRLIFYAMVPVFIARTFPRISYYYWGGMRYAIGFLVILLLFYFLRTGRRRWIFLCGMISGLSALTTVEAGFSTVFAVMAALGFAWIFQIRPRRLVWPSFWMFCVGFATVLVPYFLYLIQTDSLHAFFQSTYVVVALSNGQFPGAAGVKPETLSEFLLACIPGTKFFKYLTVFWCYIFFAGFLFHKAQQKKLNVTHVFLVGLASYGLVLYAAAFRKIEGHHFEMALQAEKFIYFFMVECFLLFLWERWVTARALRTWRRRLVYLAVAGVFLSSIAYSIQRFDRRFVMFKLIEKDVFHKKKVKGLSFLEGQETVALNIERARGNTVPRWQEEEVRGVVDFLKLHTHSGEKVFCFPEVANFNFWADRPFVGRFPIATYSWFYEPWFQELVSDFKKAKPRYVVMTHVGHRTFPEAWYFRNPRNRERFEFVTDLILKNYEPVKSFESVSIYQIKSSRQPFVE